MFDSNEISSLASATSSSNIWSGLFNVALNKTRAIKNKLDREDEIRNEKIVGVKVQGDYNDVINKLDTNNPMYQQNLAKTTEDFINKLPDDHRYIAEASVRQLHEQYLERFRTAEKARIKDTHVANLNRDYNNLNTELQQNALDGNVGQIKANHDKLKETLDEAVKNGYITDVQSNDLYNKSNLETDKNLVLHILNNNPNTSFDEIQGTLEQKGYSEQHIKDIKYQFSVQKDKQLQEIKGKETAQMTSLQKLWNDNQLNFKLGIGVSAIDSPEYNLIPKEIKDEIKRIPLEFSLKTNDERQAILSDKYQELVNTKDKESSDYKQKLQYFNQINDLEKYIDSHADIELAQKQGLFGKEKLEDIDWTNAQSFQNRMEKAKIASKFYGVSVNPLTTQEFVKLRKTVQAGDQQVILNLSNIASVNKELKYQLADDPTTAKVAFLAGITSDRERIFNGKVSSSYLPNYLYRKHGIIDPQDIAENILSGEQILKENPKIIEDFDKDLKAKIDLDKIYEAPEATRYKTLVKQNIKNYMAYELHNGITDDKNLAMDNAIKYVTGGITPYNNANWLPNFIVPTEGADSLWGWATGLRQSTVEVPFYGMTQDGFRSFVNSITTDDIKTPIAKTTKEQTVDIIKNSVLSSLGQGQYFIKTNDGKGFVTDTNGKKFLLDMNQILDNKNAP